MAYPAASSENVTQLPSDKEKVNRAYNQRVATDMFLKMMPHLKNYEFQSRELLANRINQDGELSPAVDPFTQLSNIYSIQNRYGRDTYNSLRDLRMLSAASSTEAFIQSLANTFIGIKYDNRTSYPLSKKNYLKTALLHLYPEHINEIKLFVDQIDSNEQVFEIMTKLTYLSRFEKGLLKVAQFGTMPDHPPVEVKNRGALIAKIQEIIAQARNNDNRFPWGDGSCEVYRMGGDEITILTYSNHRPKLYFLDISMFGNMDKFKDADGENYADYVINEIFARLQKLKLDDFEGSTSHKQLIADALSDVDCYYRLFEEDETGSGVYKGGVNLKYVQEVDLTLAQGDAQTYIDIIGDHGMDGQSLDMAGFMETPDLYAALFEVLLERGSLVAPEDFDQIKLDIKARSKRVVKNILEEDKSVYTDDDIPRLEYEVHNYQIIAEIKRMNLKEESSKTVFEKLQHYDKLNVPMVAGLITMALSMPENGIIQKEVVEIVERYIVNPLYKNTSLSVQSQGLFKNLMFAEAKLYNSSENTQPPSILTVEISGLKEINDLFTYLDGDLVLQQVHSIFFETITNFISEYGEEYNLEYSDIIIGQRGLSFDILFKKPIPNKLMDALNLISHVRLNDVVGVDISIPLGIGVETDIAQDSPDGDKLAYARDQYHQAVESANEAKYDEISRDFINMADGVERVVNSDVDFIFITPELSQFIHKLYLNDEVGFEDMYDLYSKVMASLEDVLINKDNDSQLLNNAFSWYYILSKKRGLGRVAELMNALQHLNNDRLDVSISPVLEKFSSFMRLVQIDQITNLLSGKDGFVLTKVDTAEVRSLTQTKTGHGPVDN